MSDYNAFTWVEKQTQAGPTRLNSIEAGLDDASKHHRTGTWPPPAASAANKNWLYTCTDIGCTLLSDGAQWIPISKGFATALPASPVDGMEIDFLADATNGVVWTLKYRSAEAGSYKWYYKGGPPLYNNVNTLETTGSLVYANLATVGPQLTLPLAGDYDIEHGANYSNNTAGDGCRMSLSIGGAAVADSDGIALINGSGGAGSFYSDAMNIRKTALAAATTLVEKYRALTGGTAAFSARWLKVTPVRVG